MLATMRLASILLVFAIGCGTNEAGDDDDDGNPGDASAHEYCVQETNRYRTGGGKPAVQRSTQLETYADTGAMVDHGGTPHDHFRNTQGGGIAFAENECPHWSLDQTAGDMKMLVAACIKAFFDEGPGGGHYDNMMGNYGTLGCGIFESGASVTILQDFGR